MRYAVRLKHILPSEHFFQFCKSLKGNVWQRLKMVGSKPFIIECL